MEALPVPIRPLTHAERSPRGNKVVAARAYPRNPAKAARRFTHQGDVTVIGRVGDRSVRGLARRRHVLTRRVLPDRSQGSSHA